MNDNELAQRRCRPCEGGTPPMDDAAVAAMLAGLSGWQQQGRAIQKTFIFRDHYEAMAFVNALAWVSHRQDHHPELTVGYRDVQVRYWTHAIGGLSENDLICAARVEKLLEI